ncbi:crossover junction endodeoxyribonuclease RuvC [Sulfurovum sp.]|uniref:crossover junction endodeoxyribonuclease RuvC n=1 Tax=Sulfurovum sp. TaxID=1969726 RepID=UPI0028681829|nr:crossover junction endodeoxyribonuclease RuvC [Sulfurovum sp.]
MNILGIDPGSRNLGYCIVNWDGKNFSLVEAGLLKMKGKELQEQIIELVEGIDIILKAHTVDEVAIEDIFFAFNPQSVLKLAQFRGALCLKILQEVGFFHEYTALQVKKAVTGNGKATKEQVAFMVKRLFGIKKEIKPLDITDAMAIALTHLQRVKMRKKTT